MTSYLVIGTICSLMCLYPGVPITNTVVAATATTVDQFVDFYLLYLVADKDSHRPACAVSVRTISFYLKALIEPNSLFSGFFCVFLAAESSRLKANTESTRGLS